MEGLVTLLGSPEWALDPALDDPLERSRRGAEINRHIRAWARGTQGRRDRRARAQELGVPLAEYKTRRPRCCATRTSAPAACSRRSTLPAAGRRHAGRAVPVPARAPLARRRCRRWARSRDSAPTGCACALTAEARHGRDRSPASASPTSPSTPPGRSARTCCRSSAPRCIKIESAQRPDTFRKPHPVYGRMGPATFDQVSVEQAVGAASTSSTRGGRAGQAAGRASPTSAAESFRPGVMERLGLGYRGAARRSSPTSSCCRCPRRGQSGPDSHFAGYAPLFGAWGGLGWMTGYERRPAGRDAPRDGPHRRPATRRSR